MSEWCYVIFDLIFYTLRACLKVYLIKTLVPVKPRFAKHRQLVFGVMVLQYQVFYMALSYWDAFRMLFYNGMDGPTSSRMSTIPLMVSMALTILFCLLFFNGRKSAILYLVLTSYAIGELIMFTIHALFTAIFKGVITIETYFVLEGNTWVLQHFNTILSTIQAVWNLSYQGVFLSLFFASIQYLKKNLTYENRELTFMQQLLLAIPSVMGLCFGIMLRSILYETGDVQTKFLADNFPEINFLIPAISGLCLASVLLSAAILKKLIESSEKEALVEIYQNRISDMEEHMKDVEHLYDGIRGMRHDMKNYVSDLEILLRSREKDESPGFYRDEVRQYLDGLCSTMEELEMKCNTGNPVTDVVISRKMRAVEEKSIPFQCDFVYPAKLGISAFDISIILNNGLDNAIEAAEKERKPYIKLDSYIRENMFFIEIRNSFHGSLKSDLAGKNLSTSKEEAGHGLGLKNIRGCASKYYGRMDWKVQEQEFVLTVMLQGVQVMKQ